jgi:membrane-bound ClpP family serine protease
MASAFATRAVPSKTAGAILVVILLFAGSLRADEPAPGLFITVRNPITSEEMSRVKELTEQARRRFKERPKIVYDFNPDHKAAGTTQYGPCHDLAEYLDGLKDVTTIAFVQADVSRYTVLPVFACEQLIMSSQARIGDAENDPEIQNSLPIDDVERYYKNDKVLFYTNIAERRGHSAALLLKMLDRRLHVVEGVRKDGGATVYVDSRRLDPAAIQVGLRQPPDLAAGQPGVFGVEKARHFCLSQQKMESRQEVAEFCGMSPDSLRDDPLQGRTAIAWHIVLRGPLTRATEETVRRKLERAVGQRANVVFLEIACSGGDPEVAASLAEYLRTLKDSGGKFPVMTIAYVTPQARDLAVLPALGCTYLVMHKDAVLGDNFDKYLAEHPSAQDALGAVLANLAVEQNYPAALVRALVDPKLAVYRMKNTQGTSQSRFATEEELPALRREKWVDNGLIKRAGIWFVVDAVQARDSGLSRHTVDNVDQLYEVTLGLDSTKVQQAGPDWFDQFALFLRHPMVAFILVMLGITCLVLELKMPGIAVPGIVSALCFLLFFWAHAQLAFTWLAVLLFALGLVLIGLEVFLVPGVAVLGASGIALIVAGLGLATLERLPQRESEWVDALTTLGRFGFGLVGAVGAALVVGRFLPRMPYASRLMLAPPDAHEAGLDSAGAVSPEFARAAALLGVVGVAATTLRPAGMVKFGDEYVDVVAEGSYVEAGTRVRVIEVEANRIVVKELGTGPHG